jgi:hypothetical protein
MQSSVYGAPGNFYDQENVRPWMPKGLVKTDNVQVNYIAARGADSLCIALMNECDRELRDVTVQLDGSYFAGGKMDAALWRDNQHQPGTLSVENGLVKVSLSPKGITALVLSGVQPKVQFQKKFTGAAANAKAITHQRIRTPFGEAQATILSFGPELTWLYAYLSADTEQVKSAAVRVELPGRSETLRDDSFPFEFSLPLRPGESALSLKMEAKAAGGAELHSDPIRLSTDR